MYAFRTLVAQCQGGKKTEDRMIWLERRGRRGDEGSWNDVDRTRLGIDICFRYHCTFFLIMITLVFPEREKKREV